MFYLPQIGGVRFTQAMDYILIASDRTHRIYESTDNLEIRRQEVHERDSIKCRLYVQCDISALWSTLYVFIAPDKSHYPNVQQIWDTTFSHRRVMNILYFLDEAAYRFKTPINNVHVDHLENGLDLATSVAFHYLSKGVLDKAPVSYSDGLKVVNVPVIKKFLYMVTGNETHIDFHVSRSFSIDDLMNLIG